MTAAPTTTAAATTSNACLTTNALRLPTDAQPTFGHTLAVWQPSAIVPAGPAADWSMPGASAAVAQHPEELGPLFRRQDGLLCQEVLDHEFLHLSLARGDLLSLRIDCRAVDGIRGKEGEELRSVSAGLRAGLASGLPEARDESLDLAPLGIGEIQLGVHAAGEHSLWCGSMTRAPANVRQPHADEGQVECDRKRYETNDGGTLHRDPPLS
jgi:hypothetical protein